MKEIKIQDKEQYLKDNYPLGNPPKMTDKKECIHCGETITVGDYKVFRDDYGEELIYCPNAPKCDGTPLDWVPYN